MQTEGNVSDKPRQNRKRKLMDADTSSGKKKLQRVTKGVLKTTLRYGVVKESSSTTLGLLTFADVICQLVKKRLLEKLHDKEQKMLLLMQLSDEQRSLIESVLSELRNDVVRESNNAIAVREGNQPGHPSKTWAWELLNDNRELIMTIFFEFMKLNTM